MELSFCGLRRIPEEEIALKDVRYLALLEVDLFRLYRRWGRPDIAVDDLAEWLCFAFSLPDGDKFALQREAQHPPTSGFLLSVTIGLFSEEAAEQVAAALDVHGARVLEVSAEVTH
ncbi:hypothetical protein ABZ532_17415 [Streptomyces sp. NPDC019396]|uniref:hypothetical protein n=1 Tax=Streptomyces sp. NPDC019396 TaxID=3154687 RepID=UPI0033FE5A6B